MSIRGRLANGFDDSFLRDWARIDALNSRIFGSVADSWKKKLRQGVRAKSALTRSFYVLLGFIEYSFLFIFYALAFLMSAGGYDLPHDDDYKEQCDEEP